MKEAIITLAINQDLNDPCIKSMEDYAKKYHKDLFVITKPKIGGKNFYFEKYQYLELLNQGYQRILYLDSDVLITPHARNIFDVYSDSKNFYAFDENLPTVWMNREEWINQMDVDFYWPVKWTGLRSYFNAGVQLLGLECKTFIEQLLNYPFSPKNFTIDPSDQTALNFLCFKLAPEKFSSIDYQFNRMDLGEYDLKNKRYQADFIHYAGPCKYGSGNKVETIAQDYKFLYGTN